jgi:hypothetical protein
VINKKLSTESVRLVGNHTQFKHTELETITHTIFIYLSVVSYLMKVSIAQGARGGAVIKALRYKPEGRGFDSRWCQNFSLT